MSNSGLVRRVDLAQQRRTWVAFPYAVYQKYSDDQAGNLAALLAYYAFFSIFPLLLVLVTVLAYVVRDDPALRAKIFDDVLASVPIMSQTNSPHPISGSPLALVAGSFLALWNGLAVAQQAEQAMNILYAVPYHEWPGFAARTARSIVVVLVGGGGLISTTVVTGAITAGNVFGLHLGFVQQLLGALVAVALNTGVFTLLFRFLTVTEVRWRDALPGACFTAVGWYAVQLTGTALFAHYVAGAQRTYGTFATVIGMLTILALLAQITLYGAEINVVRSLRLWPRGLGSLSGASTLEADYRSYTSYAKRQRYAAPDQEQVEVNFPNRPPTDG